MRRWYVVVAAAAFLTVASGAEAKSRRVSAEAPKSSREIVDFEEAFPRGAIVIKTEERKLYYTLGEGRALRYSIAVGEPRFQWSGELWVSRKASNPAWSPTPRMRRENPRLPRYVSPGPKNPLGPRAMYLGWSEYRIHGTNVPDTVGMAASSGCFRMFNADAIDLYDRVHLGAPVYVLR
jgi:lipoprotein-anchoring transpeptidase ErfK/SrfK